MTAPMDATARLDAACSATRAQGEQIDVAAARFAATSFAWTVTDVKLVVKELGIESY